MPLPPEGQGCHIPAQTGGHPAPMVEVIRYPRGFHRRRRSRIPRAAFLPALVAGAILMAVMASDQGRPIFASNPILAPILAPDDAPPPAIPRGGDAWNGGSQGLPNRAAPPAAPHSATPAAAPRGAQLTGRVTRLRDGDTLVLGRIPIRIANLDCAERGTAEGDAATRLAHRLVHGQTLTCRLEGRRSHDREVGLCSLPDGRDFGQAMIAAGACARWR